MIDLSLYVILDPAYDRHSLTDAAAWAAQGGASIFQLRDKTGDDDAIVTAAQSISQVLKPLNIPFLLNDRADLALQADADGVHVGQSDMPPAEARAILGPDKIIGLSVRTMDEAEDAPLELIDYAAIGGVFATGSKTLDNPPIGTDGLRRIATRLQERRPGLPTVAISGMTADRAPGVIGAGADGVAVISAVIDAPDVQAASRQIADAVRRAKLVKAAP